MKEFKHGKITLLNCDCMDYMAGIEDNAFDLAVVDPPYGINVNSMNMGGRKRASVDKLKSWDLKIPSKEYFKLLNYKSINQVIWGGNYFGLQPSQYFCIWDKGESIYGRGFAECEYAWVKNGGTRIFKKNPNQPNRIHPTQKPVALYKWIYSNYAKPGQRVIDTHLGSGSSAIAAHYYGLEFVGIELDTDYYNAAVERFKRETRQTDMFQPQ